MKLTRIRALIEQYKQNIIDNTLSDEAVDLLLNPDMFAQSPEDFDADLLLEGENYGPREAMQIFVLKIVSAVDAANLHQLIEKMIARTSPVRNVSALLQQPSLIKYFIAYIKSGLTTFTEVENSFIEKLNLQQNDAVCKAVTKSITNHANSFFVIHEQLAKEQKTAALDSIAAAVVAQTTERKLLTALDFGPFTPTAPATNPYKPHESASENDLLQLDPFAITKAKNNFGTLQHNTVFDSRCNLQIIRQMEYFFFASELSQYAAHYSQPLVQMHQALFHPEKRKEGILQAQSKAKVANEFILYLTVYINSSDSDMQEKFNLLLRQNNNLSAKDFFDVSNEKIKLSEELQKFLSPTTPYIKSKFEKRADETMEVIIDSLKNPTDTQPPSTALKKLFGGFGNMFSSSSASTVSDNPYAGFIVELDKYIAHYGSTTTQLSQLAFHSKDKRTSTGILESVAKTNIAKGIKLALENKESNIPERFTALLTENGLDHDRDAFFAGTKEKVKLSATFETLLKGETKAPGMTLSAVKEEV